MKSYEDLEAWQSAMNLIVEIYRISARFPDSECYGLTSQIRRAAVSIAANIAEGFGRYTYKDKANKYVIARGECLEVESFLHIVQRLTMLTVEDMKTARKHILRTKQLLSGLIRSTRSMQHIH